MPDEEPVSDSEPHPTSGSFPSAERNEAEASLPPAWQPLTPLGVAAFSRASIGRLFLVELIVALLGAMVAAWFLTMVWFPAVREAMQRLPDEGVIRDQRLISPRNSAEPLAEHRFLGFVVDVERRSQATLASDVRVEFHRNDFRICSLLGCLTFAYPRGWEIQFNRPELEAWWGAWRPTVLSIVVLIAPIFLIASWTALAALYCPLVYLLAYFKDRNLSLGGSWRVASAALLPGTFVMFAAIIAYGAGALDLVRLLLATVLHVIVSWVYLIVSPLALPKLGTHAHSKNPFFPSPKPPQRAENGSAE